ncbi:MAG: ATP-binding protein [Actinomycetota bacterium]|nr:ATP-binding protein [Actinomycetota bacterium]
MGRWQRNAKVAFIGSHGIRKTTAAHGFANAMQRAGRSVEYGREVVRDNPLGINEGATGEAQLWVLVSQIRQELTLAPKAEVLVLDRGVMDNYAYYLRACGGDDRFAVAPLVDEWSKTYDLVIRLHPDVDLSSDGVRSTSDEFRVEIERILDDHLEDFVEEGRLVDIPASEIGDGYDWWPIAERLAALMHEPLFADGVPKRRAARKRKPLRSTDSQLTFGDQ